ncbi:MAG: ATP-binding cassette domain-containing protein [Planctomycetes bacterium]|nr:ATP-binding cassette domain-containing protein [Planctomycetota bacterium]
MIDVRELSKRFPTPGGGELTAVDSVSFTVNSGDVYGLLGSNGAGKTTTLRMILGLLKPTSGWATIDGYRSDEYPEEVKRRVGLVSANAGLYQYLSPREMLLFFADLYGVPVETAQAEFERLSQLLGLTEFADRACSTLSTGQRQRVNLARALIHSPPVMLLDEPTLGLDVLGTQVITEFIAHLRHTGKAVILCTHHLDEAERICNRFGLMHRGQIVAEGDLAALREQTGCRTLIEMFIKLSVRGAALAGAAG